MIISLIVAKAENNAIGKNNDLIWHLPDDMNFFKETTKGHYVIMGRRNYESIPKKYRPLPGRPNIIVTSQSGYVAENCDVVGSIEEGLKIAANHNEKEAFIIGGGQIYEEALKQNLIQKMYITFVHHSFDGDVYFPEVDWKNWKQTKEIFHPKDDHHPYSFSIGYFEKK